MSLSSAREIAYDAFTQVLEENQKPDDCLEQLEKQLPRPLKRIDRNLAKEILYGSLRWYSKIFWILQNTAKRNLTETSPQIRSALICGTYQIFYLDKVPDRAAVFESVEYIRKKGQSNATSFVNGILRQIARRAAYFPKPDRETHPADYLSLQYAHPRWIVERWLKHFHFDRMEAILSSNNKVPPLFARCNLLKVDQHSLHKLLQDLLRLEKTHTEKCPLRGCFRFKDSPNLEENSLFCQGFYSIQDEAAQLVSLLVQPEEGQCIVDACTGPGGKLSHIFELAQGKLKLLGIDKNQDKIEKTQQNLKRLGHEGIELLHTDFLEWKADRKVDKILLDAPCSGLGVLRRHPEGKWQKKESVIYQLAELQKQLLTHALKQLNPGGELIYSVCSFEREETIDQWQWLKQEFENKIEQISPVSRLPDYYKKYVTKDNLLLIFSGNQDDTDGFGAFVVKVNEKI